MQTPRHVYAWRFARLLRTAMMRVVLLTRSLDSGGAERQLVALARSLNPADFSVTVVTYYAGGALASSLEDCPHVRLVSAGKRGRWDFVGFLWRMWKLVREARPHVIHSYMYGVNELALLLAYGLRARVVWGIRASGLDMTRYAWSVRLLAKTGAFLSARADAIIANSEAGRSYHIGLGYPARRFLVIPNGIDVEIYRRDASGRQRVRAEWGVSEDDVLIGIVARMDPMKDHDTFLRGAGTLASVERRLRFVVVGPGSAQELRRLETLANECRIAEQVIWAGARTDMAAVYSALDIATSSSAFGEGFSNSLAEAMACETVCVATDVGDARTVVGDTGEIVPPRQPAALAAAWHKVLRAAVEGRAERGRAARARIVDSFSTCALADRTGNVLRRVVAGTI